MKNTICALQCTMPRLRSLTLLPGTPTSSANRAATGRARTGACVRIHPSGSPAV